VKALRRYRTLRNQAIGFEVAPRFFVNFLGKPLGYFGVSAAFRRLCRGLGWTQPPIPRLHDLRHHSARRVIPSSGQESG
jgi:integrase